MSTIYKSVQSPWRAAIESGLYANSVKETTMEDLYNLALKQPEVVATTEPMWRPEQFGLPKDAVVLVSNDGGVVGRTARARRLVRELSKPEAAKLNSVLLEALYQFNRRPGLWLKGIVGLHPHFMIRAHLLSPATDAKNMLDWGINFTPFIKPYIKTYEDSVELNEPDILVFADPEWRDPDYPSGLVIIDEKDNCIAILGMRYFGERKKGTLTLAWTMGVRHNMVACHGGIKKVGNHPPVAVFGLSGSGKSSITNSHDHGGTLRPDEKVTVVHDDAFLIDFENNITVALEPTLFDKTDAVKFDDPDIKYFYSAQNVAIAQTPDGQRKLLCEDVRNDNGRCLKSRDMFNYDNWCESPKKVVWLQKDTSLPPICRLNTPALAVAMGASLSTMRAKGVENVDAKELEKLVIEPFANPFRVHPLLTDCTQFLKLFKAGCECYIMNTHAFGLPDSLIDIPKELSLRIMTELVRGNIEWRDWKRFQGLSIPKNGNDLFAPDYDKKYKPSRDTAYLQYMRDRMQDRITCLSNKRDLDHDMESSFIDPLVLARTALDKILHPV